MEQVFGDFSLRKELVGGGLRPEEPALPVEVSFVVNIVHFHDNDYIGII